MLGLSTNMVSHKIVNIYGISQVKQKTQKFKHEFNLKIKE